MRPARGARPLWAPAAAAVAFGAGIALLSPRLNRSVAVAVLLGGLALLAATRARRAASPALLRARGLVPPAGPRERVLVAAGFVDPPARRRRALPLALVAGVVLGGGWGALRAPPDLPDDLHGRYVRFTGTAAEDPRAFDFGWGAEARIEAVASGGAPLRLRVWLSDEGPAPRFVAGSELRGGGIIRPLGASGFEGSLRARGMAGIVSVTRLSASPPGNALLRLADGVRSGLAEGASRALPRREAALALGLLIGRTDEMDPEVERDLRASGLGHLVAVSGANVAMVLAPVLALTVLLRLRPGATAAVGLAAVLFFALVTRWEPSVIRATAMASLALLAVAWGRRRDGAGLLGVACLGLLVADPSLAWSLGFRLSAAATAGILWLAGPIADRLARLPRPLALAVGATVGAQAAVTPLLLVAFGSVPTVSVAANLLAMPAVGPAFLLGGAASGAALLWAPLGEMLGAVARLPLAYLVWVADVASRLPAPAVSGLRWVLPAAVVVGVLLLAGPRRLLLLGVAAPVLLGTAILRPADGRLEVVFLDVGQGDAAVVRTPEGGTLLIDAGPDEDLVALRLAELGIRRIDIAVATHAHADHVEGFAEVFARHPVGLLLEPGCPGDSPSYRDLLDAAAAEGIAVRHPRGGDRLAIGELVVEVLGPDGCAVDSPNDDSIVLRLRYRGATALFPGDAEVAAQQDLLADGDPVRAAVLKVPHHGGGTSDPAFLRAVGATLSVVSVGENDYGHPVPDVLRVLREAGGAVARTDLAGDLRVLVETDGVQIAPA